MTSHRDYGDETTEPTDDWEATLRYCEKQWAEERGLLIRQKSDLRAENERLREVARWLAEQPTTEELLASGPPEWVWATAERRIEMMGERKRERDAAILNARAALKGGK
jgi:hypothetical protein